MSVVDWNTLFLSKWEIHMTLIELVLRLVHITCFFFECVWQQIVLIVICAHAIIIRTKGCITSADRWLSHKQWLLNRFLDFLRYTSGAASHAKFQLEWSHIKQILVLLPTLDLWWELSMFLFFYFLCVSNSNKLRLSMHLNTSTKSKDKDEW